MSSALTGNQIKDSYQALLKIGTNGSLDPTTAITISDGLGNDTPLQLAADKLLTNYSGNNIGLNLDFASNLFQFGDFNAINSGTSLHIDDASGTMLTQYGGQIVGLQFDFVNKLYNFGDFNATSNGTHIHIDDDNQEIQIVNGLGYLNFSAAFESPTANTSSGKYLKIYIDGNEYRIDLLDP